MAISVNLNATMNWNTAGGENVPAPVDTYNSTASVGTYFAGPVSVAVTSTPASVPLAATPATAVYELKIQNTGSTALIVDMRTGTPASCKVTIAAGGAMVFHNCTITAPTGTAANTTWANWQLSTASGTTTATLSLVYT